MNILQAMKEALDAFDSSCRTSEIDTRENLRAAIEEREKAEPADWDINSMDAAVWAKAFAERFTVWSQAHGVESDTFGLMVGWFANAIMAGYDEATRRHPAPTIPDGWKLVPIEPTLKMIGAAEDQADCLGDFYRAMLAAAPEYKP